MGKTTVDLTDVVLNMKERLMPIINKTAGRRLRPGRSEKKIMPQSLFGA